MKVTPMMKQYLSAKESHPDAVLFFRMGDFYEMLFEDAETVSQELGLTLTARNKGDKGNEIPMAGVPHHAAEGYIGKLVAKGFKVAVCDQLEAAGKGAGVVRRGVTRVITPGVMDGEGLDEGSNNYLAAVCMGTPRRGSRDVQGFGLAYVDASTGDFKVTVLGDLDQLATELSRIDPGEVVVPQGELEVFEGLKQRAGVAFLNGVPEASFERKRVLDAIAQGDRLESDLMADRFYVDGETAKSFFSAVERAGFADGSAAERAVAGALAYLIYTQLGVSSHIQSVEPYRVDDYLVIDDSTRANLELTETLMGGRRKGSLLHAIDMTVTSMGARRLRSWLAYPLVDVRRIERRLDAVQDLRDNVQLREELRGALKQTYDIERLTSRVSTGSANARDLLKLGQTLETIPKLVTLMDDARSGLLRTIHGRLDPCDDLRELLGRALADDPPTALKEGGLIRQGYNDELDELIDISENGKDWLLRYEAQQKQATDIGSLKVKFNKVFGYFIEVTKANLHLVPDHYIRKQTLSNSERYFTPELKEYEEKVLTAEDKRCELEYRLFEELRAQTATYVQRLRNASYMVSTLDVLAGLAETAHRYNYCRPVVDGGDVITIQEGRHPVVELHLEDERFVPNSVQLDNGANQLLIITGPNMAGKSTVIRQVAVLTLMAQMGSFVPAREAHIGVVDKIFSRVGASDNLVKGQSTFMVEMTETAHILSNATRRSLIILDEIGRGTSTYDGLSIAWAVTEFLHDEVGAKTLFATHYHELTGLHETLDGVQNFNIAVKEYKDDIVFLRKLVPGPANRSYGIQVGRLAGLPQVVVERAKVILQNLELTDHDHAGRPMLAREGDGTTRAPARRAPQLSLLDSASPAPMNGHATTGGQAISSAQKEALELLQSFDVSTNTPLEALNLIYTLKKRLDA